MPRHRAVSRIALVCAAVLALPLAGCKNASGVFQDSNEGGWFAKPVDVFTKPEWAKLSTEAKTAELGPKGPVGPEDLVDADGRCVAEAPAPAAPEAVAEAASAPPADRPVGTIAGDLAGPPMPAATLASITPAVGLQGVPEPGAPQVMGGIALGMTECQAARRAGAPGNVNIGTGDKGERKVVLTYLSGPWPGIYRFGDGRLKEISRAPTPPAPPKAPSKKKAKKPAPKPKTAAVQ